MNYKFRFFLGVLFCFALTQPSGYSRQQVDSSERLNLLNQTTGSSNSNSGSSASFQTRLDAILDTNPPSKERTVIASDDAAARAKIIAQEQALLTDSEKSSALSEEDDMLMKSKDSMKVKDQSVSPGTKVDGTEKAYQKERTEIKNEFDERIQKALQKKSIAAVSEEKTGSPLDPSLANNPFYFAQNENSSGPGLANDFESRKPLIASRIAANGAMAVNEAADIVRAASSSEELVLKLIRDYNYTYGQASDAVS